MRKKKLALIAITFLTLSLSGDRPHDIEFQLQQRLGGDGFSAALWMAENLGPAVAAALRNAVGRLWRPEGQDLGPVERYFAIADRINRLEWEIDRLYTSSDGQDPSLPAREAELAEAKSARAALEGTVEEVIAAQMREVLRREGLAIAGRLVFPPVVFRLATLPNLLVVSPRDRIWLQVAILARPGLRPTEMAEIEWRAEELGVSALVVPLGGLGTFPSMVSATGSARFVVQGVAHEWAHNLFTLRPLGWRYALGIESDYQVVAMNERAADIISSEVGAEVDRRYYGGRLGLQPVYQQPELPEEAGEEPGPTGGFDFNREMRQIRRQVDALLAEGRVAEAEQYMEERRQFLVGQGHYLRKLNQAYFAFYGSYEGGPGGEAIDPIGQDLRELRRRSRSLREFVDTVSGLSSYNDLKATLATVGK